LRSPSAADPGARRVGRRRGTASTLAVQDVVERIEGPGYAVAHLGMRLLQQAHTRARAFELLLQEIPFTLECCQALGQRLGARASFRLRARDGRYRLPARLARAAPGHRREPAAIECRRYAAPVPLLRRR